MASYAHYALQRLRVLPGVFAELPLREQMFIIASIDLKVESEPKGR